MIKPPRASHFKYCQVDILNKFAFELKSKVEKPPFKYSTNSIHPESIKYVDTEKLKTQDISLLTQKLHSNLSQN